MTRGGKRAGAGAPRGKSLSEKELEKRDRAIQKALRKMLSTLDGLKIRSKYGAKEAAAYAGVSTSTIYKEAKKKGMIYVRYDGWKLFSETLAGIESRLADYRRTYTDVEYQREQQRLQLASNVAIQKVLDNSKDKNKTRVLKRLVAKTGGLLGSWPEQE